MNAVTLADVLNAAELVGIIAAATVGSGLAVFGGIVLLRKLLG